jgi:hypothetical protein
MFGCGKFGENEMLLYVEGRSASAGAVQEHLMACAACLDGLVELNRVNAEMDGEAPAGTTLPGFITVFSGIDKATGAWNIIRAIASAASARWEPLTATRDGGLKGRTALIELDREPLLVRISPDEARSYRIALEGETLNGRTVELRRAGSVTPVFLKKADSKELTISNVGGGDYELTVADAAYRVNLREAE